MIQATLDYASLPGVARLLLSFQIFQTWLLVAKLGWRLLQLDAGLILISAFWFARSLVSLQNKHAKLAVGATARLKGKIIMVTYGSISAGREKWPFNVLFFLKVEPPCDQT